MGSFLCKVFTSLCGSFALELAKGYPLDVGGHTVCLPKGAYDPHAEWLAAIMKRGAEAQPVLASPTNDLGREIVG